MLSFSQRHGYSGEPKDILVREDAPKNLRFVFLEITHEVARRYLEQYPEKHIRSVVAKKLGQWVNTSVWHYDLVWKQVEDMVYAAEWFRVYDIMEEVNAFFNRTTSNAAEEFAAKLNEIFIEQGVGWQLVGEEIVTRSDEAFESIVRTASSELTHRPTTQTRIQEALKDLSRRPKPDLTGAISHAFSAMESIIGTIEYTPEELRNRTDHTLGAYLQRHPELFPSEDFRDGLKQLWKYANNEGSRHGKEGIEPLRDEAEFVVSLAAALVTYLNRKHPQ